MKRNITKTIAFFAFIAILLCTFSACEADFGEYSSFAMGSYVSAKLYADKEQTDLLWEDIAAAISNADSLISATDENSDIGRLNRLGKVKADDFTLNVMMNSLTVCNICNKKLDITLGAVTQLWGFSGETPSLPTEEEISEALTFRNIDGILINEDTGVITVSDGQKIDLGAFGKGAACDAARDVLQTQNIPCVLSFGGTVLLYGENPSGNGWNIGIRDPEGTENDYFATINIDTASTTEPVFVSTSGNYEKTFEENGKTYHHILDPETGYPVENGIVSVTVIGNSGLNSDALSTACFINGANEETLTWLGYFGAEAVFVFDDGSVYATDGIKEKLEILSDGYTLTDTLL